MATRPAARKTAARIPQLAWNQVRPAPVVLVSGTEDFLADRAIARLRDILRAEDPSLEVSELDAAGYGAGSLATLASPSLFAEPRLIRVMSVEKCSDAFLSEALEYLASPAEDCCLVLRHGGGVRGKKLLDAIRSGDHGAIEIVCGELKRDVDRQDFVVEEFALAGRRVSPGALRALVSAFAEDLAGLAAACRQLIADTDDDITEQTVARYYAGRIETNAFRVADIAVAGRGGEALVLLRHAFASGADPVQLVAAFASKVRTMAKVHGERGSGAALASQLGLAPWQVDRARRDVAGWTDEGLGVAIEVLAETDAAVKGTGRDPQFAVERMVRIVGARGRRP